MPQLPQAEYEQPVSELEVTLLTKAIGYGDGTISHLDRRAVVGDEVCYKIEEAIHSPRVLHRVDVGKDGQPLDDDGCGDGRGVAQVFKGTVEKSASWSRAKVFGGAPTMVMAAEVAQEAGKSSLEETYESAIALLEANNIGYGGHTDEHAHGDNCGCGAIDKSPQVFAAIGKYETEIVSTAMAILDADELEEQDQQALRNELADVTATMAGYGHQIADKSYSGSKVMDDLIREGKETVVKKLRGDHNEMYILLNTVTDYTTDQAFIREVSGDQAQVFAVDVWRLQSITERTYSNPAAQRKALFGMLVYTLGTAATLTKGDLPVYRISLADAA